MLLRSLILAICTSLLVPLWACAQGTKDDYERAASLRASTNGKVFRDRIDARWLPDGDRFWYRVQTARGAWEFVFVDVKSTKRQLAFDHEKLAAALSGHLNQRLDAQNLPIDALDLAADGKIHLNVKGAGLIFDPQTEEVVKRDEKLPKPAGSLSGRERVRQRHARANNRSPDGEWEVRIANGKLSVHAKDGDRKIDFADSERLNQVRVYWAPDSLRFVVLDTKPEQQHTVHMVESSPKDQVQPRLQSHQYLKPGDRIRVTKPRLFDVEAEREIAIDDALFKNPWSIDQLRWAGDSSQFSFVYNQRGHQVLRLVAVSAKDGAARTLIEEAPETFVDYAFKQFAYYVESNNEVIWMSERNGRNHLYRFDADGSLINKITSGDWVVRGVDRVDEGQQHIWFRASGLNAEEDPYHVHYCRVNFDAASSSA